MREVCKVAEIAAGEGRDLEISHGGAVLHLAVFRLGESVRVYRNVCPHQGRSLNWAPGKFLFDDDGRLVCPHHGACFDLATGKCVSGPCRGGELSPVEVSVKDGVISLPGG